MGGDEIHLWRASLDVSATAFDVYWPRLSAEERGRANRFRLPRDSSRFVIGRGVLRTILARYLGADPPALRFRYGPFGKPALITACEAETIRFNVSHSGGLALYAVARGREVGVDLERIRPDGTDEHVAARFFSPREVLSLLTVPPNKRPQAFFVYWTRKEAYVKGVGGGLSLPLDRFDVSSGGQEHTEDGDRAAVGGWAVQSLSPAPGFIAAVAAEGIGWKICRLEYSHAIRDRHDPMPPMGPSRSLRDPCGHRRRSHLMHMIPGTPPFDPRESARGLQEGGGIRSPGRGEVP